jgi:hypothetical protein
MWMMPQISMALGHFVLATAEPEKLEVWWRDAALCVFKAPPPGEMAKDHNEALTELNWQYCDDPHEYGEECWYLFRSD